MFTRKNSKSKSGDGHRRAASTGSAPRLFVSPPKISKTSRNEQRVRKAPCVHLATPTPLDDEALVPVGPPPKTVGFFVNPPAFCIDEAADSGNTSRTTKTNLQTLGVPMMGTCSDFYHSPAAPQSLLAKPNGPKRVVSTGSASTGSGGPRVLVNPPAFATTTAMGGTNRVRKTWGVPMV